MNRVWTALIASAITVPAFAQSASVYLPTRSIQDQGISLRSWGSGTISETDELAYEGTHSLRVSTRNFFQGGLMAFSAPVNLTSDYSDKNNLLRMTFRVADASVQQSGGGGARTGGPGGGGPAGLGGGPAGLGGGGGRTGGGAGPAGLGGGGGAGAGAGGQRGGGGPVGGQGHGQGTTGGGNVTAVAQPLRNLRFIVTTTDGKHSEVYVPIATSSSREMWQSVSIPLQAIRGFDKTNKEIKEIGIAGDATSTIYVGELKVVNDKTPITGEPNVQNLNLALGDEVAFSASGFGGSTVLKYSWDFDDKDGIQEDAVGQFVRHKFRKPGTYTITMTIADAYGLKPPYTRTIKAVVNP